MWKRPKYLQYFHEGEFIMFFLMILIQVGLENGSHSVRWNLRCKTLIADDKYSVQDCENLSLPIQMQLSEK